LENLLPIKKKKRGSGRGWGERRKQMDKFKKMKEVIN
jgi:hypothetical protein